MRKTKKYNSCIKVHFFIMILLFASLKAYPDEILNFKNVFSDPDHAPYYILFTFTLAFAVLLYFMITHKNEQKKKHVQKVLTGEKRQVTSRKK